MKNILFLLVVFFFVSKINAQQFGVIDSVPVLITDTQSVNDNFIIPYNGPSSGVNQLPIFYEKRNSYSDTASIWCRNITSMSPEMLFLQSGNGTIFKNPICSYGNILWCESNFQGQFDIYGFKFDNNFDIIDTFRLTNDTFVEKSILGYYDSCYWVQKEDSLLICQHFNVYSDSIHLLSKDTIDNHCISVYPNNYGIIYTKYVNDSICLQGDFFNTTGNITYINSTISDGLSYLWQNGDSIYTDGGSGVGNYSILINPTSPYIPSLPSSYTYYTTTKFDYYYTLLSYSVPDSSDIIAISPQSTSSDNHTIYYEDSNSDSLHSYEYKFPSSYDIKQIQIFDGYFDGYFDVIYITLRVLVGNTERLYYIRYNGPIISRINTDKINSDVILFPNPTTGNFIIEFPENTESTQLTISSITGQIIKIISLNKGQNTYQFTEKLPAGVYFVKVQTDKGALIKKFVKQ